MVSAIHRTCSCCDGIVVTSLNISTAVLPNHPHTTLTVFTPVEQKVVEHVNGDIDTGYHEVQFNGTNLASGVYFYRMQAGSFIETKKLCLVH